MAIAVLPGMAAMAIDDFSAQTNPVALTQKDAMSLLESVFDSEMIGEMT